jgi:hypothetical protein
MVPTKLINYKDPFLFALKAIALPIYLILLLRSPLLDKSKTLRLLQSPKAIQNYLVRELFKFVILFSLRI